MKFFEAAVLLANTKDPIFRPSKLAALRDALHPTCPYYEFLYKLVSRYAPLDICEIGTYAGTSAAHLAYTNYVAFGDALLRGSVLTIDINPDAKRCVEDLDLPNVTSVIGDSLAIVFQLGGRKFDVIYVDGLHTYSQAYREYWYYRDLVREGGLMIFDDVGLVMDGDEMNVFWDAIPEPKARLDHLHATGFGIVEKTNAEVLDPAAAMERDAPTIIGRRTS